MNTKEILLADVTNVCGVRAVVTKLLRGGAIRVQVADGRNFVLSGLYLNDAGKPCWILSS